MQDSAVSADQQAHVLVHTSLNLSFICYTAYTSFMVWNLEMKGL